MYQNGRAVRKSVLGELRSQSQMDYIAVRGLWGNQLYMLAAVLSHNLNRELQMETKAPDRALNRKAGPALDFRGIAKPETSINPTGRKIYQP